MSATLTLTELTESHRMILAALYLRGLDRIAVPSRRHWPRVLAALRKRCATLETAPHALADAGFDLEALLVQDRNLIEKALRLIQCDRVVTADCGGYPARWLERLGASAPPAIWWNGVLFDPRDCIAIVGSRHIDHPTSKWATAAAELCASKGRMIVSGGAIGCDRAAARGAWRAFESSAIQSGSGSPIAELLPFGLGAAAPSRSAQLSVCAWDDHFTTAAAMERNSLIYASSPRAIVVHARPKMGGAWTGAVDAIRRRLTQVAVWDDPRNEGANRLIALGARPIASLGALAEWLEADVQMEGGLYAAEETSRLWGDVREPAVTYAA